MQTIDCYGGRILTTKDANLHLEAHECNPVTGPIYVEGAEVGDIIGVTIHDIIPNKQGVTRCCSTEGQLCHTMDKKSYAEGYYAVFFDVLEGECTMQHKREVRFPSSPMLGVIGVALEGDIPTPTMPAGAHGGNLDNNNNGIGSTVYFKVRVQGALVSIGDMHAAMGDGEICGNGIEIGGDVLLSISLTKKKDMRTLIQDENAPDVVDKLFEYPVTETCTHWITHGVAIEDIDLAMTKACESASLILQSQWGFTPEDAFVFLGVQGDLGLCQNVHPSSGTVIAKMKVPRIAACPGCRRIEL